MPHQVVAMQSRKRVRCLALVAVLAVAAYPAPTTAAAEHDDDNYENEADIVYDFSYEVKDAPTGTDFGHRQNRNGLVTQGQYRVLLPDGRMQIVDYVADPTGFQPSIRYQHVFTPDNHFAGSEHSPQFNVAPSNLLADDGAAAHGTTAAAGGRQKRRRRRRSPRKPQSRRSRHEF